MKENLDWSYSIISALSGSTILEETSFESHFSPPDRINFDSSWKGEWVNTGTADIYIEQTGADHKLPPLLCIHNFSDNSRQRFAPLLPRLTRQFNCILLDLRGHGRSTNRAKSWNHEMAAGDVTEVIRRLGLTDISVLATSSGGMAMLRVARNSPELIRSMVLDSATYRVPPEARRFYLHPDRLSPRIRAHYEQASEVYGEKYWNTLAGIFYDFRLASCDINIPEAWLQEIITPTLLIAGDRDFFFPIEIHTEMQRLIPASQLYVASDTSHIVMDKHPRLVAELAATFLSRHF